MAFRAIRIALVLSGLSLAGCGTVTNLVKQRPGEGGVSPFGGVRHDMQCITAASNEEQHGGTHTASDQVRPMARKLLWAADLPATVIGDVVTWPYTAAYTFINRPILNPPTTLVPIVGPPQTLLPDSIDPPPATLPPPPIEVLPPPRLVR